jgi:hypothetical protein
MSLLLVLTAVIAAAMFGLLISAIADIRGANLLKRRPAILPPPSPITSEPLNL